MPRKSRQEYQETLQYVKESFTAGVSYWGIDKVTVGCIGIRSVDVEQLMKKNQDLPDTQCKVTAGPEDHSILSGIASIRICQHGYALYAGRSAVSTYAIIDLVSDEKVNVRTQSVEAIMEHLNRVKDSVVHKFSIDLIIDEAIIRSIEIAYTTISDMIPIWSRYLVMKGFYRRGKSMGFDKPSKTIASDTYGDGVSSILVKNKRAVKTGLSYVFYDKTREMIDKKEILEFPAPDSRIYRFEAKISGSDVKKYLRTNKLKEIADTNILDYVYLLINNMADAYRRQFLTSVSAAKRRLRKSSHKQEQMLRSHTAVLKEVVDIEGDVIKAEELPIIDQESFLYCSVGKDHGTRLIWKYIDNIAGSYLTEMYGWIVEDVINDMLDAYYYNRVEGLGCHPGSADDDININHFCYNNVDQNKMREYFRYLIRKNKPRYTYMVNIVNTPIVS
ncbi:hypothetical protein ACTQZS_14090 [Bilifractor sp. LCP19S3_H10]|uniref:hypothetical protein n=1 Tax=Bilifractor sp. LCP19S3_H10 TaxID=3438736 RepID=UPI003F9291D5